MKKIVLPFCFTLILSIGLHVMGFGGGFAASTCLTGDPVPAQDDRAYLGVQTADDEKGARVVSVVPGSPAERAGLKAEDIITRVGNQDIDGAEKLAEVIRGMKPDQKVSIVIFRNGKKQTVSAVLGVNRSPATPVPDFRRFEFRIPNPYSNRQPVDNWNWIQPRPQLGMQVQDTDDDSGVTVLKVTANGPAATAGVREGDLITGLNEVAVRNVSDIQKRISETKGNEYKLDIIRDKKPVSITVVIPKKLRKADL